MKPTVEACTVALPWYEPDDFRRLWELAHDHDDMPADYEDWHAAAVTVVNAWLARGRTLQIITIKPDEFLAWLEARGLLNTSSNRLAYVEEKAKAAGSETRGLDVPDGKSLA